jgi:ADP-ribosylglycohydrolase
MTSLRDRFTGCLVGLAVGDALGYPAEFRRREQILREIGPEGITDFIEVQDPRFTRPIIIGERKPPGTYTDDTQMTLAIADALIARGHDDLDALMNEVARGFVAWSKADDNDRSPGATCMTGCENLERGVPWREAGVADSKGCGSAMRVAPIGLFYDDVERLLEVARASSLLTHGHDAAVEGAAACALLVRLALEGAGPEDMHREVAARCGGRSADFDACWAKVPEAAASVPPAEALTDAWLGESWVAEEAAASALYCAWREPDDFRAAVLCAVNTDGDSDSIACITGSILGAKLGVGAVPQAWVRDVENSAQLHDVAARLHDAREERS